MSHESSTDDHDEDGTEIADPPEGEEILDTPLIEANLKDEEEEEEEEADEDEDEDGDGEEEQDEGGSEDPVVEAAGDAENAPSAEDGEVQDEETEAAADGMRSDYKSGRAFADFPLSKEVIAGLEGLGYTEATQVQAAAIEPGLAGRDLLVRAKTGTGKTCAFCVPVVEGAKGGLHHPQAIILSPTRELASQIAEECAGIARYKDLRILSLYGGVSMVPQERALEDGVDIIVGTPGRVLDHMRRKNLHLDKAAYAVLDEADEMLSMGFFQDVNAILSACAKDGQVLLFSATVNQRVKQLVSKYLKDPVDIMLSTDADRVEGIEHILYETDPGFHRVRALLALIDQEEPGSTIIFCNTREDTATVANFLSRQGLDAQLLSGELPQGKRTEVMNRVKSGAIQFLVATDVAARGIDISDVTHVINYSLPADPPVYLHRIGRTGRIGKKGKAISLVGGPDLATRNVLERQFDVEFNVKIMPTPEEASELRVKRQVARIQEASGTTPFEGFLPLVRSLKERGDEGDLLLATALRVFFVWDREQTAKKAGVDSLEALKDARDAQRSGGRGRGRRGGDRSRGSGDRNRRPRSRGGSGGNRDDNRPPRAESQEGSASEGAPKRRRRRRRRRGGGGGGDSKPSGNEG